jgi:hypothetical protein
MKYASDNPITNLLLAGCLVLTAIFAAEWSIPYTVDALDAARSGAAIADEFPAVAQSRYVHPHISNYPEILARPIFFSKRELPPEAVARTPAPRAPLRLKLEGIAIAADTRVAVLRDQGSNQLVQLSVGMSYNNWLLEDITPATATFRRGDEVSSVSLKPENR